MSAGTLKGQVAVVTGANSGVGRSATEMLLGAGVHVTMICRSRERGEQALAELRGMVAAGMERSGEASPGMSCEGGGPDVALELADMSSLDDVRAAADRIAARLPAIDILVNNAGISRARCVMSRDGFELTFATNHLGHFLLTHLLLERLAAGRGRIVNVSSKGHRHGDLKRADLDDIARGRAWRGGLIAYGDSKLANILFTTESVPRWGGRGITANAVHPGVLATEIWKKTPAVVRLLIRPFTWFMDKPDVGGAAVMNLIRDPARDEVSGRYFDIEEEAVPGEQARDERLAQELWDRSLEWTGVRLDQTQTNGESNDAQG